MFFFNKTLNVVVFCVFLCVPVQAADWSSCWSSVALSFPGPAPITVSATLHPAQSPAKPTTSCQSLKVSLLTVNASSCRTIRSIAYYRVTSAQTLSPSGFILTTSHTSSPPLFMALRCWRSWIWETTATCAPWLRTPFMDWIGSMRFTFTAVG